MNNVKSGENTMLLKVNEGFIYSFFMK